MHNRFPVTLLLTAIPMTLAAQDKSVEVALVANSVDATVAVIDVATRAIIGRIDVNPAKTKASGPGSPNYAQDTDVSPAGKTLYVSRGYMGDVAAFDLVSGKLLWKTSLKTGRADHMTITRDGKYLFVSAMLDNRVYRVEAATGKLTGFFVTGVYPHDNKVSSDGKVVYNTSIGPLPGMPRPGAAPAEKPGENFQITIVDVATMQVREKIPTEFAIRPWQFAPDGKGMYVQLANEHVVAYYDLGARRFTRRFALPVKEGVTPKDYDFDAPHHGLALTDDGMTLCLAGRASDYAALVSVPDFKLLATIPTGDAPGWAEVADGGKLCLITNTRDDDVSIISIEEQKEILRLPTGDGPKHITVTHLPASVIASIKTRP